MKMLDATMVAGIGGEEVGRSWRGDRRKEAKDLLTLRMHSVGQRQDPDESRTTVLDSPGSNKYSYRLIFRGTSSTYR
jgi:hypothetical protein